MKKRLIALLLALSMTAALAIPAGAVSGMDSFNERKDTYKGFTDVPADAWYGTALKSCYESKLMQGTSATTFNPLGNLTVAAAVVMAARVNWVYNGNTGEIPRGADGQPWYQPAYEYALAHGILTQEILPEFDFSAAVTRAQMAYLFARALPIAEQADINTVIQLPDVEEGALFGAEIFQLYRAGVLTGNDLYGTFAPESTITRQAACAIIARLAFPAQRQTPNRYERFFFGETDFAMPANSEYEVADNAMQVISPDSYTTTVVTGESDAAYKNVSILTLTADGVKTMLEQTFSETGLTAGEMELTPVKFGSVDAYRATFMGSDGTAQIPACAYLYIYDSTMYFYIAMTLSGSAALNTLANSVTVNGSPVSVKLG